MCVDCPVALPSVFAAVLFEALPEAALAPPFPVELVFVPELLVATSFEPVAA